MTEGRRGVISQNQDDWYIIFPPSSMLGYYLSVFNVKKKTKKNQPQFLCNLKQIYLPQFSCKKKLKSSTPI